MTNFFLFLRVGDFVSINIANTWYEERIRRNPYKDLEVSTVKTSRIIKKYYATIDNLSGQLISILNEKNVLYLTVNLT